METVKKKYAIVTIITRREKIIPIQECLLSMGIEGMSVSEVEGNGRQNGQMEYEESNGGKTVMLIPKVQIVLYLYSIPVKKVIDSVLSVLASDMYGAGKIFVQFVEGNIYTVRTGEIEKIEEDLDMGVEVTKKPITKVSIITRKEKFEELRKEMVAIGVTGMTVSKVNGCGTQHGISKLVEGVMKRSVLNAKIQVDIVVCEIPVQTVIDTAMKVLRTGNIGDGKIFTSPIDHVVRVRTGEKNEEAI